MITLTILIAGNLNVTSPNVIAQNKSTTGISRISTNNTDTSENESLPYVANSTAASPIMLKSAMDAESTQCDASLMDHVYHNPRLDVVSPCMTVSGTVKFVKPEDDMDYHLRVKLDPQFGGLVNDANINGYLVVEPICEAPMTHRTTQAAIDACDNFAQDIRIPNIGDHVDITGVYVLDRQHGWMEIHPVTNISPS